MIPEDIRDKIEKASKSLYDSKIKKGWGEEISANYSFRFIEGAEFCYRAMEEKFRFNDQFVKQEIEEHIAEMEKAESEIKAKNDEIERLQKHLDEIKRLKYSATDTKELFPLLQYISNNL